MGKNLDNLPNSTGDATDANYHYHHHCCCCCCYYIEGRDTKGHFQGRQLPIVSSLAGRHSSSPYISSPYNFRYPSLSHSS